MKIIVIAVCMLMYAVPLLAETYTWEDDSGTVNFTENYSSVPLKYRKHVKKLGEIGTDTSAPVVSGVEPKATVPAKGAAGSGEGQPGEAGGLYGGKKAEAWQQEMRPLYAEVKRLEQKLVELESLLKSPVGISRSRADGLPQEFKAAQQQYNHVLKQYNSLNDEANKVGLPAEFRK